MKSLRLLLVLLFALDLSAATIIVTGTGDAVAVDGACTLREAITAANTNAASGDCAAGTPGLDQIHFAIGSGFAQISLFTPLPDIVDPVTIDGTTQPGFAGVPLIQIIGANIDSMPNVVVQQAGGGSTFRGLIVTPNQLFGGGIALRSSNNVIAGNYFGTTTGTVASDMLGTHVMVIGEVGAPASNNVIGGGTAADRNVFVSLSGAALGINAAGGAIADANQVVGNYIGWNPSKTVALGALREGIAISGATNTIVSSNSIVGTFGTAISINLATGTIVQSNEIGGTFGNFNGIAIAGSNNTIIGAATSGGSGGNVIVGNGAFQPNTAGVLVFDGTGNRISGNSMSLNGILPGMGIDLLPPSGPNTNDACDADTGANLLQNKPMLTGAFDVNDTIVVEGTLNSTASSSYTIELYANPPAVGDQGHQYIGSVNVTTDASCNASFTAIVPFVPPTPDWTITATAIDAANNTSEMSAPGLIVELDAPTVSKAFNPTNVALGETSQLTITLTNPNASAITGTAFTDDYPAGLRNAAVPNVTNTCGGVVTALPGGETLSLTGGTIPANGSCTVSVFVTPVTNGSFVNELPAGSVTSANAPPSEGAASATLTAGAATADVPLSPAALMLLAIALSGVGAMVLRR